MRLIQLSLIAKVWNEKHQTHKDSIFKFLIQTLYSSRGRNYVFLHQIQGSFSPHLCPNTAALYSHFPQQSLQTTIKLTLATVQIKSLTLKHTYRAHTHTPLQQEILSNRSMTFLSIILSSTARTWNSWSPLEEQPLPISSTAIFVLWAFPQTPQLP